MKYLLLLLLVLGTAQAGFRDPSNQQFKLFSNIPFVRAADFNSYAQIAEQNIYQTRGRLIKSLLKLTSYTGDIYSSLQAIKVIESLYQEELANSTRGFSESFSAQFSAELNAEYNSYNIAIPKLITTIREPNMVAYGTFSTLKRGRLLVTMTLTKLSTGEQKSFKAIGSYNTVIKNLTHKIFSYFEGNRYESYKNPFQHQKWILPAPGHRSMMVSRKVAILVCQSQGARLPSAEELQLGQASGAYFGGIDLPDDIFLHLQEKGIFYYSSPTRDPLGQVQPWAGRGTQKAYYVCIKDL